MKSGWVKWRINYLKNWKHYVGLLAKSVKEVLPEVEIYVIGGAAENRLTILSDIDVLVVTSKPLDVSECRRLKADIIWNAEKHGFPWDYPVEIHIISKRELKNYLKHTKNVIRIKLENT